MRFLFSLGLTALSISSVYGAACIPKNASPNHSNGGQCVAVQSDPTDIVSAIGPVTISIPTFDTTAHPGAILDAVWINWVIGDYLPDVKYRVSSSGSFGVSVSVNNIWSLFSNVDSKTVTKANLNTVGLQGVASVDPSDADGSTGCVINTDAVGPTSTQCKTTTIENNAFQIFDVTYVSTPLTITGVDQDFNPDYSQGNTYTDFVGFAGDATNGFLISSTPAAGYSSAGAGTWGLTTSKNVAPAVAAQIGGSVTSTGTGVAGLTVSVTHHLLLTLEVQYDFHVPSGGNGDPQFMGFQGQSFQVHGAPDAYFALISAPSYYVNARFDYISTGSCTYNETACFTHPGTYMGMIYVGMKDANILIQAGPHATGFASILVNDKPMTVGDRFALTGVSADSYIQVLSKSKLILTLDNIMITVHNSDLFVNFDLSLTDKELLSAGAMKHVIPSGSTPSQIQHHLNKWYGQYNPLHGLIGQTWRNVKYQDNKLFQGDITEYQLDKIVDHTFLYCVYEA